MLSLPQVFSRVQRLLESTVRTITNWQLTVPQWLLSFTAIVVVKGVLELFSSAGFDTARASGIFLHIWLFYVAIALAFFLLLSGLGKISITQAANLVLVGLLLIWTPSPVDLAISGSHGAVMAYLFDNPAGLWHDFLTFFGPQTQFGFTIGMRVQVALAMLGFGAVVWILTKKIWRTLAAIISTYIVIFFYGALPSLWTYLTSWLHHVPLSSLRIRDSGIAIIDYTHILGIALYDTNKRFDVAMSLILLVIILVLGKIVARVHFGRRWWTFVQQARLTRVAAIVVAALGGAFVGWSLLHAQLAWNDFSVLAIVALGVSAAASWLFAVTLGDLYDIGVDTANNKPRPLVEKTFTIAEFRNLSVVFGLTSLLAAAPLAFPVFVFVAGANVAIYVYTVPPLRLKRWVGAAEALIALHALLYVCAGFILMHPDQDLADFPQGALAAIFFGVFAMAFVKDIGDETGDRRAGIITLATLFGHAPARWVVSVLFAAAFLATPFFLHQTTLVMPGVLASLAAAVAITQPKKPHQVALGVICLCYALLVLVFLL